MGQMEDINDRISETLGIEKYFTLGAIDTCYKTVTKVKGGFTLTVRVFGLCGLDKRGNDDPHFMAPYDTTDLSAMLVNHGAAKQWTSKEMTAFTTGYGAFLVKKFTAILKDAPANPNEDNVQQVAGMSTLTTQPLSTLSFTCAFGPRRPAHFIEAAGRSAREKRTWNKKNSKLSKSKRVKSSPRVKSSEELELEKLYSELFNF